MSGEDLKNRFKRVAEARTNRIIRDLNLLGNCSEIKNYEYTQEQVDIIFEAIDKALLRAKNRFSVISVGQVEL